MRIKINHRCRRYDENFLAELSIVSILQSLHVSSLAKKIYYFSMIVYRVKIRTLADIWECVYCQVSSRIVYLTCQNGSGVFIF